MKQDVYNFLREVRLNALQIISKSRILTKVYFLFDTSFDREYEFTMRGRVESLSSKYTGDFSNANIRRCIHRIEKGLFHVDRRDKFGSDVIDELVREIKNCEADFFIEGGEVEWALSTLKAYFPHATNREKTQYCLEFFNGLSETASSTDVSFSNSKNEEFELLTKLYVSRESVRFFKEEEVPEELIRKAVEIAKEAPSACNRQPFSILRLTSRKDIEEIGGLAPGTKGFLENIPTLLVAVGHASSFRHSRDRHLIYTDTGLFIGHLLPALRSMNIDTCVLNWIADWQADRNAIRYLGLDLSKSIVCLIAVGYRRDFAKSPVSTKKSNSLLLRNFK